jgi:biopolymer transport protein ExbB
VWELLQAGGITMIPLAIISVLSLAISAERFWVLRKERVSPRHLVAQVWNWFKKGQINKKNLLILRSHSPLGIILAAGLLNHKHGREVMKESIRDAGRGVVLELEKFLNFLGTIAAIAPLLGLLGTVIGMIRVFTVITTQGVGDAAALAGGISEALITTATGLVIAIPAFIFYRFFQRRVDELVAAMEEEALKLVEVLHGERDSEGL